MPDNQESCKKMIADNNAINIINTLWMLLDDIDTLDDAAKNNDAIFRKQCYEIQQKRWKVYDPDDVNSLYKTGKEQLTLTQQALDSAVETLKNKQDDFTSCDYAYPEKDSDVLMRWEDGITMRGKYFGREYGNHFDFAVSKGRYYTGKRGVVSWKYDTALASIKE